MQELSARAGAGQLLARYWPQSIAAMRVDGGLYGQRWRQRRPRSTSTGRWSKRPRNLDELERQATDGVPLVLDVEAFADAFWDFSVQRSRRRSASTWCSTSRRRPTGSTGYQILGAMRARLVFTPDAARQAFMDVTSGGYLAGGSRTMRPWRMPWAPTMWGIRRRCRRAGGDATPLMEAVEAHVDQAGALGRSRSGGRIHQF
ncbi:MAG: hypothetical protein R3A10_09430 [Caldilineaceae bacterium]